MSEYSPAPLASNANRTRLSDLEANFRAAVAIVGGSAYSGGSPSGAFPGAMGKSQIKASAWISNDRKTEPYSLCVWQAQVGSLAPSSTAVIVVPGLLDVVSPSTVSFSMAYESAVGGANVSGTLQVNCCATVNTFTNVAPFAAFTATKDQAYSVPASGDPDGIVVTLANSSVAVTMKGVVVTVTIKAKHVA